MHDVPRAAVTESAGRKPSAIAKPTVIRMVRELPFVPLGALLNKRLSRSVVD